MKNTIIVSAVTSFITVVIMMFVMHLSGGGKGCHKGGGHGEMRMEKGMHHGGGHGYHKGGSCAKGGDSKSCHKGGKSKSCHKGGDSKSCDKGGAKCDGKDKEACKKSCDKKVEIKKEVTVEN